MKQFLFFLIIGVGLGAGFFYFNFSDKTPAIQGLAHININTKNIQLSADFYQKNLDFEKYGDAEIEKPDGIYKLVFFERGDCKIELVQPPDTSKVIMNLKGTINHISLEVQNIEELILKLKKNNVPFTRELFVNEKILGGITGVFIAGPSGESIELVEFKNYKNLIQTAFKSIKK